MSCLLAGAIALSLAVLQAAVPRSQPLEGMDVFGAAPGSIVELERCFGAAARELAAAYDANDRPRIPKLKEDLERKIKEAGGFAEVEVSVVAYFGSNFRIFLTFDLAPAGQRPSIEELPAPTGDVADPGGLLASWREYEKTGDVLDYDARAASPAGCPAHHCLFGFEHPKLRPFGERFAREVPARRDELVAVLLTDEDAEDRATAAFLLAHLPKAEDVLTVLLPRLRDPAPVVRNNVMRVLSVMAEGAAAGSIPIDEILPFLGSHELTDRNKAVAIVAGLAAHERHRARLVERAGCALVRLLEMKQPNHVDWAHQALVKLRGTDLGASDSRAWRSWLATRGVTCRPEPEIGPGKLCPLPSPSPAPPPASPPPHQDSTSGE